MTSPAGPNLCGSHRLPPGNAAAWPSMSSGTPRQVTSTKGFPAMTMDKSLRVRKGSSAARGVLSRAERIVKLKEQEKWGEGRSPLGLPKVRVYKMAMKKKKKAKEEGADAAGGKGAAAKAPAGGKKK